MKFSLKATLNGVTKQIQWLEQNATSPFILLAISNVGLELEKVIMQVR